MIFLRPMDEFICWNEQKKKKERKKDRWSALCRRLLITVVLWI